MTDNNIFSGDKRLAVLTNPTELAYRKGNLKHHYPITVDGKTYPDAEAYYMAQKASANHWLTPEERMALSEKAATAKLQQYPQIVAYIDQLGGADFLRTCTHFVGSHRTPRNFWEGTGEQSYFIRSLISAYQTVKG